MLFSVSVQRSPALTAAGSPPAEGAAQVSVNGQAPSTAIRSIPAPCSSSKALYAGLGVPWMVMSPKPPWNGPGSIPPSSCVSDTLRVSEMDSEQIE